MLLLLVLKLLFLLLAASAVRSALIVLTGISARFLNANAVVYDAAAALTIEFCQQSSPPSPPHHLPLPPPLIDS